MHEWALADAVVTAAAEAAHERKLTAVTEIVLTVGELQSIDNELFGEIVQDLMTTGPAEVASAKVRVVKGEAAFQCKACNKEFTFADCKLEESETEAVHFIPEMAHVYMRCPGCGSPDFSIVRGRGVAIQEIIGQS